MTRQFFTFTLLFLLICLSIPLTATAQIVNIPDPNLRTVIEHTVGKAPGATITVADMLTLTELYAIGNDISDLTGLEHATNLKQLWLVGNFISDISALARLTQLIELDLGRNSISDISALAGLTQLTRLGLRSNSISDLSPLVENTGIGAGDYVRVKENFLNTLSFNTHIPALQGRGVIIEFAYIILQPEDFAQTVDIPDPNLRSTIEDERSKAAGDTITVADMLILVDLSAFDANISDLTGLEAATNLTSLWLWNNNISDISVVAELTNLTELWLEDNSISDISPLVGLTDLTELRLHRNSISDLSPLVANTGLGAGDWVNVRKNFLNAESINTHIPALQSRGVTVEFDDIIVHPEDIAQTADIPDPNLRDAINSVRGKAPDATITVADMAILTKLFAPNANISDLTGLEHATNLTLLDLGAEVVEEHSINSNSISDISPLARLNNLTGLWLDNNLISNISVLEGLTNLTELGLWNNSISDISPLAGLINLTELSLYGNSISDISTIVGLTNLTELLDLGNNSISDISAIEGLNNLTILWLDNNLISDTSAIEGLTNLTELYLGDNSISDISVLTGLTDLTELSLHNNSISDLSPVVANTGLGSESWVDVTGNPLSALSINTHIPALQSRGVIVEFDDIKAQAAEDVNGDGVVNIFDLVSVASQFGKQGQNLAEDVNGDGVVDVRDLVLVAGMFAERAAAPSAQSQASEILTAAAIRGWLTDAKALDLRDPVMERGVAVLQQLLASLTPTETELLANYPNPFNPETWIPYRLAEEAFVTLTIYDGAGRVVRTIDLGHQTAAAYESRSQAIYWDGRNEIGERVASGVYFYHLFAGDYSATRKMLILK